MKHNKSAFFERLEKSGIFKDMYIDFSNEEINITDLPHGIEFTNCTIIAKKIYFKQIHNNDNGISFENCNIQSKIVIQDCKIHTVSFSDVEGLISLEIRKFENYNAKCEIDVFQFSNNHRIELNTEFRFQDCKFKSRFGFYDVNHVSGLFGFTRNDIGNVDEKYTDFVLSNSNFKNIFFQENIFLTSCNLINCAFENLDVEKIKRYQNSVFIENTFKKIGVINSVFRGKCHFISCSFTDLAFFELKNNNRSEILFYDCNFNNETSFNNSEIGNLIIDRSVFHNLCTLQDTIFDTIKIDRSVFEKAAFFDNVQINKIHDCTRRTIRNIKQQLQKTENRIDFNRFKNYEMAAYYNELTWKNNFIDKSILWSTKISTDFGNNWAKALVFTLISGLAFYLVFFIFENYKYSFDLDGWQNFAKGYIRFFLLTDFYNPLENDRIYIKSFWSWIPFILGKFIIAFGIYEMIQSFRKFKA